MKGLFNTKVQVLMVVTLVLSAVAAGPVLAKGAPVQPVGTESCWVNPNPATNGLQYTVLGSGFKPGQMLNVFVTDSTGGTILMAQADATGSFSTWAWTQFVHTGAKNVTVYQMGDRRKTVLTSCSFTVN